MKKLYAIVLISLLATSGRAYDLATSFKQAAALGDAQEKERATQAYIHLDLMPYYQKKSSPVFQSCLASTDHPDPSPFSFVTAIGKRWSCLAAIRRSRNQHVCLCAAEAATGGISAPAPPSLLLGSFNELF